MVPEFPAITVGGALAGTAGESSSFRHGFLADTISWVELILPTGEVVGVSKELNSDLFHGFAGSFSTLGILTLLKVELMEAKRFVELTYHLVRGIDDAVNVTRKVCGSALNDYVDGIFFSKAQGAVITARFTDTPEPSIAVQTFTQARDEWYYLHVEHILNVETLNSQHGGHRKHDTVK